VPVAYDAKLVRTVSYTHPDASALAALADFLRPRYLHPEVREKGGAYGGFSVADAEGGIFALASYRDPHIARTFSVFDGAAGFVLGPTSRGRTWPRR
jgi:Zn-dependent M16 (insulinase) family peptidase